MKSNPDKSFFKTRAERKALYLHNQRRYQRGLSDDLFFLKQDSLQTAKTGAIAGAGLLGGYWILKKVASGKKRKRREKRRTETVIHRHVYETRPADFPADVPEVPTDGKEKASSTLVPTPKDNAIVTILKGVVTSIVITLLREQALRLVPNRTPAVTPQDEGPQTTVHIPTSAAE
ncbi:MAG: hypothetical protein WBA12_10420 [Catalinimonas sp.]